MSHKQNGVTAVFSSQVHQNSTLIGDSCVKAQGLELLLHPGCSLGCISCGTVDGNKLFSHLYAIFNIFPVHMSSKKLAPIAELQGQNIRQSSIRKD